MVGRISNKTVSITGSAVPLAFPNDNTSKVGNIIKAYIKCMLWIASRIPRVVYDNDK